MTPGTISQHLTIAEAHLLADEAARVLPRGTYVQIRCSERFGHRLYLYLRTGHLFKIASHESLRALRRRPTLSRLLKQDLLHAMLTPPPQRRPEPPDLADPYDLPF